MEGLTAGRIVHYVLRAEDAQAVNRRRDGYARNRRTDVSEMLEGAQIHVGNMAREGDHLPMIVIRVWENEFGEGVPGVNGQVFLDGNDQLWVTSVKFGEGPGTCHWIEKV